jgi:hypothetical protein
MNNYDINDHDDNKNNSTIIIKEMKFRMPLCFCKKTMIKTKNISFVHAY